MIITLCAMILDGFEWDTTSVTANKWNIIVPSCGLLSFILWAMVMSSTCPRTLMYF